MTLRAQIVSLAGSYSSLPDDGKGWQLIRLRELRNIVIKANVVLLCGVINATRRLVDACGRRGEKDARHPVARCEERSTGHGEAPGERNAG